MEFFFYVLPKVVKGKEKKRKIVYSSYRYTVVLSYRYEEYICIMVYFHNDMNGLLQFKLLMNSSGITVFRRKSLYRLNRGLYRYIYNFAKYPILCRSPLCKLTLAQLKYSDHI